MAFRFKKKESVAEAIPRLGLKRVENALACLEDCARAGAIHSARKEIKKVRAVVRLVRTGIGKKDFRRVIGSLREAAKPLAGPRDAWVHVTTLQKLKRHFKGQFAPGALCHIRAAMNRVSAGEMQRFTTEKSAEAVGRVLRRVGKEVARLRVKAKGWAALRPGVRKAYAEGRRAYRVALRDSAAENFHEWRKRAKDLWYQVTLLQPAWPEQMDAMAGELETLGECLGDDHDLVMLRIAIREDGRDKIPARELRMLDGLLDERQAELRATALALGARFYAEKSSAFCGRLAGYWKTWRGEKSRDIALHSGPSSPV